MKRRTVLAVARAEKRARYKGGQQVASKYGIKKIKLLALNSYPYTEANCPGHVASNKPQTCDRCGAHDASLSAPVDYNEPEF